MAEDDRVLPRTPRGLRPLVALAVALAVAWTTPVSGRQTTAAPATVGLALSGGSAKGIAHIGVLQALERIGVRVDVVAGTSMGGVVGGMYALGLSVDSIANVMRSADWSSLMTDATARSLRSLEQRRLDERAILAVPLEGPRVILPAGAIVGSNALRLLEHVTWRGALVRRFEDLSIRFGAVATDLETGEPVPLRAGVLSEALRASASLPGAVEPILLNGRLLVDGALSRNLPATDARQMGADFVICSDVSEPIDSAEELRSFVDVLSQLASLSMLGPTLAERDRCDVLILPEVDDLSSFDFERVDDWIERGVDAAQAHDSTLRALAESQQGSRRPTEATPLLGDSVLVTQISVVGAGDARMIELARRELELDAGDYVSRDLLESRMADLESSGLFSLVRYRLDGTPEGVSLTVQADEGARDRLAVGLRYDDERRAALLFTATAHNVLVRGAVTRLDLRVGEEMSIGATLRRRRGLTGRLSVGLGARWSQGTLRVTPSDGRFAEVSLWTATVSLGLSAARSAYLGVEGVLEAAESPDESLSAHSAGAAVVLDHETLDRIDFPRSGTDVSGRLEWGVSNEGDGGEYAVATFDSRAYLPLGSRITVDLGVAGGYTRGAALPAHERIFLGGAHRSAVFRASQLTFQGLDTQAQTGRVVQVGRVGVRVEPATDWFVRAGVDVGAARDSWRLPLATPMTGWSLAAGFRSRIGPVVGEVTKVWGHAHDARLSVSVGRWF